MKPFPELWADDVWRARANQWTRLALAEKGIAMHGELLETQIRPWSIVLHTETDHGKIYFKATPPALGDEMALTERLAQWFPKVIPQVLGVERTEGWWLAGDGGDNIRAQLKATRDLSEWSEALRLYAELQIGAAARVEELIALGVPDRRPRTLPAQFVSVLDDTPILRIDQEKGITADEYTRLRALAVPLTEWCARLEAGSVPNSLHHGDLNSGNVLLRDGKFAFVDWGDASLAHPFASLRTVFVSVEIVLDLPDYDLLTAPLRDAYLAAWTKYDSPENLLATFALAHRVSSVVSLLSWYQFVKTLSPTELVEYEHIVPSLLQEFLHADLERYPFV